MLCRAFCENTMVLADMISGPFVYELRSMNFCRVTSLCGSATSEKAALGVDGGEANGAVLLVGGAPTPLLLYSTVSSLAGYHQVVRLAKHPETHSATGRQWLPLYATGGGIARTDCVAPASIPLGDGAGAGE